MAKKTLLAALILIISLSAYFAYENYVWSETEIVCGRFIGQTEIKGAGLLKYEYRDSKGVRYTGTVYTSMIKNTFSRDSLFRINCIKIKCSIVNANYCDIVDKRVLK